ncbi:hypothetical protein [Deinococcus sp.]|uniref:hypothetical protein n=1 Tax=Deinococcus sp. TaxID=47478 RepID=UPI0025CEF09B|nr:hypothetical protein [Deinococcus sp.]
MNRLRIGVVLALGGLVSTLGSAQAAGVKVVDCAKQSDTAVCKRPSTANVATIGEGVPFYNGGFGDKIVGGFVQGGAGIFAVSLGDQGIIVSVDLATGNRTLVSGMADANTSRGKSTLMYKLRDGTTELPAYVLGGIRDVKPLPNGNYVALINANSTSRTQLVEVNAKTGDRSLIWADEVAGDTHPGGLQDKEQYDRGRRCLESADGRRLIPSPFGMAVDAGGAVYLGLNNNPNGSGFGFARIRGGRCELFSYYDFQLGDKTGSGFKAPRLEIGAMTFAGNTVYAVHGFGNEALLTSLNPASGERALVSAVNRTPSSRRGQGERGVGYKGLAVSAAGLYSVRVGDGGNGFEMTKVDLSSGNRSPVPALSGPLKSPISDDEPRVFAVPGSPLLLICMERALMVFDPVSGNSSVLSY